VDPTSDKTASSIRATLSTAIQSLSYLEPIAPSFSIRNWTQSETPDDDRWVFLSMMPEQRETLRPLISTWTSVAIKSLLGCTPDASRRMWFFMDELPSLNKLSALSLCLAEGRKHGAAMVLGLQNVPQLETIYGSHVTKTLLDLCSTKVLFRAASYEMAELLARTLGEHEVMEVHEGISYGANDVRDGVNLSMMKQKKPVINAQELIALKNLEAYLRLPELPYVTKLTFTCSLPSKLSEPFIDRNKL